MLWYSATGDAEPDVFFGHGCFFVMPAENVTALVEVVKTGQLFHRGEHVLVQDWQITNSSGSPIPGPISLVLDGLSGAEFHHEPGDGETLLGPTASAPYRNSPAVARGATLAPGFSVRVRLTFSHVEDAAKVTFTPRILATGGLR